MTELTKAVVVDACRYVDRWLGFQREHHQVPGVQAAVLFGGDVVLSAAHGVAALSTSTPLTSEHQFRIASHSKTFTATAIMQLVERGLVRLDDSTGQWIEELDGSSLGPVTLRELLSHAGGVVRDGNDPGFWSLQRPFLDRASLVEVARNDGHVLDSNERFKYSNIGYSLLGLVIERASGSSYHDWVRAELIEPLELSSTDPEMGDRSDAHLAAGHSALVTAADRRRLEIEHVNTGAMAAATGFSSTATDLVRWFAAHFVGDERIVTDGSKRVMQHGAWPVGIEGQGEYGLGLGIDKLGDRRLLGHGGGYPGHITRSFFDPIDRLAVSVLTNAIDGPATALAGGVIKLIDLAAGATAHSTAGPGELERFEGRFGNLWGVYDLTSLGGRLHLIDPSQPDPVVNPTVLDVVDRDTLRIAESIGYGAPGELLRIERNDDDEIVAIEGGGVGGAMPLDRLREKLGERERITLADPIA